MRVLERQPSLSSSGPRAGGLRVPPNMSKILKRWVGEEAIRKSAVRCLESPWWDCECIYPSVPLDDPTLDHRSMTYPTIIIFPPA